MISFSKMDLVCLPDFSVLSFEDLQEEYKYLFEHYQSMKRTNEENQQQVYELKRHLNTAKATEAHLTQELETFTSNLEDEVQKVRLQYSHELEEYKSKFSEAEGNNIELEKDFNELRKDNESLKEKIEEISIKCQKTRNLESDDQLNEQRLSILQKENLDLLAKLEEFQEHVQKSLIIIAERDRQIEILNEKIQCCEENLKSKCEELLEKSALLESSQEQIIEINAELSMLKSCPENSDRKGNSLFAEVDDQRQVMKRLLAVQKKSYMDMKKVYNESAYEIRRLKRENAAMNNELKTCSTIFLNSKKTYEEKLNERIHELLKQNENLERKLKLTQDRLISLANENGNSWLDSMLSFCNSEVEVLKSQLHNCRLQKSLLESNLLKSEQEYAKWRFEALISRCILIDRESLLEENGIKFKDFKKDPPQLKGIDIEKTSPKILVGKRRSLAECLNININTVDSPESTGVEKPLSQYEQFEHGDNGMKQSKENVNENNIESKILENKSNCTIPVIDKADNMNLEKENEDLNAVSSKSILVKEKNILAEDNYSKYVKFDEKTIDKTSKPITIKKQSKSNIVIKKVIYPKK